jgi:hypothetical protein
LIVFAAMAYFAARLAQGAELVLRKSHHGEVSMGGWLIALAAGAYFGLKPMWTRATLGRAMEIRKIVVVRKRDAPADSPAFAEILAGTNIAWTELGLPAAWRKRKL